jgi:hypothetical protein
MGVERWLNDDCPSHEESEECYATAWDGPVAVFVRFLVPGGSHGTEASQVYITAFFQTTHFTWLYGKT